MSEKSGRAKYLQAGYYLKGTKLRLKAKLGEAFQAFLTSAQLAEKLHDPVAEGNAYGEIAATYSAANNHMNAMHYYQMAIATLQDADDPIGLASALNNAGDHYLKTKQYDSALVYCTKARELYDSVHYFHGVAYSIGNIGMAYAGLGKNSLAEKNINEAITILQKNEDYYPICVYLISMSNIHLDKGDKQQALRYATRSLQLAEQYKLNEQIRDANLQLSQLYDRAGDLVQSYSHFKNYIIYRDTVNNITTVQRMYDLKTIFERAQQKAALDESNRRKKLYVNLLYVSLFVTVIIAILILILLRNFRQKQKAYSLLEEQKTVIEHQRDTTDQALRELKQAQAHLIHSEKMASLGQLTAGVAHEIQNPLNFVNNFSDLNRELIAELEAEFNKGNTEDAKAILSEISANEEKISQHGKRAEAIVTGMLEHSRSGPKEKRLTNINALADEYLRLSFHGIRAKDKTFNASIETNLDPILSELNIVPQEIGRVILNLANNAFYAVSKKARESDDTYIPVVSINTQKTDSDVMIKIKDNGVGINSLIKDRIFQPFFTTKGPGVGTGLGLSLSYDIVKAHGGELKVESNEGAGSEFIITLPA